MHLGAIVRLVPVALGERSARIASRLARCLVWREPEREAVHWNDLLGRTRHGIAGVPAGMRADRHRDVGHANAPRLVAISIHRTDESWIERSLLRGKTANPHRLVTPQIHGPDEGQALRVGWG